MLYLLIFILLIIFTWPYIFNITTKASLPLLHPSGNVSMISQSSESLIKAHSSCQTLTDLADLINCPSTKRICFSIGGLRCDYKCKAGQTPEDIFRTRVNCQCRFSPSSRAGRSMLLFEKIA